MQEECTTSESPTLKRYREEYNDVQEWIIPTRVPLDAWSMILVQLPFVDLVKYRRVCTSWNKIILVALGLPSPLPRWMQGCFQRYRDELLARERGTMDNWRQRKYDYPKGHWWRNDDELKQLSARGNTPVSWPPNTTPWRAYLQRMPSTPLYPTGSGCNATCNRCGTAIVKSSCSLCDEPTICAWHCPYRDDTFREMYPRFECRGMSCQTESCAFYAELALIKCMCLCTNYLERVRICQRSNHAGFHLPVVFCKLSNKK